MRICRVDGCDKPIEATELCTTHRKQRDRQRTAFMKVYKGRKWHPDYFVPDPNVKRGRPATAFRVISWDQYPEQFGAGGIASDLYGNAIWLDKKKKPSRKPKDGDSAADNTKGGRWDANYRKKQAAGFRGLHWAERDRAVWLRSQGERAPRLPRQAHVPTIPCTRNPSGWGKSEPKHTHGIGTFTRFTKRYSPLEDRMITVPSGYKLIPTGLSKACNCRGCKLARKTRTVSVSRTDEALPVRSDE